MANIAGSHQSIGGTEKLVRSYKDLSVTVINNWTSWHSWQTQTVSPQHMSQSVDADCSGYLLVINVSDFSLQTPSLLEAHLIPVSFMAQLYQLFLDLLVYICIRSSQCFLCPSWLFPQLVLSKLNDQLIHYLTLQHVCIYLDSFFINNKCSVNFTGFILKGYLFYIY